MAKDDELVAEAFKNAAENGYTFEGVEALDVAIDMCNYDSDIENRPLLEIANAVLRYRAANPS